VHAIGASCGNSANIDIITVIYDDRSRCTGNTRELHVDLALEAINYKVDTARVFRGRNESNTIVNCPYFTTNFIPLTDTITISKTGNSFTVYMCIDGAFEIEQWIYISIKKEIRC
jgi:mannose-6-phosphate isomerase